MELAALHSKYPAYFKNLALSHLFGDPIYHLLRKTFHLQVYGFENVPLGDRFLYTHNHSGWVAIDSLMIGANLAVSNKIETLDLALLDPNLRRIFEKFKLGTGDFGVTFWNKQLLDLPLVGNFIKFIHGYPAKGLSQNEAFKDFRIFATPAEGEEGNCKSVFKSLYKTQRFKKGFARLALECELDYIVPVAILGPEETFPSLGPIRFFKKTLGTILPLPAPIFPIPVEWEIHWLPPIKLTEYLKRYQKSHRHEDRLAICDEISNDVQARIQDKLDESVGMRSLFCPWPLKGLRKKIKV